jgi:hypothetical protein
MPAQDQNMRKLAQILKAKTKVEEATSAANIAKAQVLAATEDLHKAVNPVDKNTAETNLKQRQDKLDEANDDLELAHKTLASLLQTTGWLEWLGSLPQYLGPTAQYLVFFIPALIVITGIVVGVGNKTLLPSLSNIPIARGLITFLIAVVTVAIALILALATVISDSKDREQRFLQGKEVLTALIGVLGTIVGFYFGHSHDGAVPRLEIAGVSISNVNPKAGEKISLEASISAGRSPYAYEIVFAPSGTTAVRKGKSTDGHIKIDLEAPNVPDDSEISILIEVTDSEGKTGFYNSSEHGKLLRVNPAKKKLQEK